MAVKNDDLAPYIVKQVDGLQECLKKDEQDIAAKGAYGVVYKVSVRGFPCIAKRLHKVLLMPAEVREKSPLALEKFRKECVILSRLKHPNVVHFVGVHLGKNESDLTLLMECLPSDLAYFLQIHKNIPLSINLSILLDVSYGLLYLHTREPPIIHRDLTARNILVTFDGQAKIADLGVAKCFDRKLRAHTQTPGHLYYMPPEALKQDADYTQKIDIFSFGHLALYTMIQEEPKIFDIEHDNVTFVPNFSLQTLRRETSLKAVGEKHCIFPIMNQCLQDQPDDRPTTEQLCIEMKEMCVKCPKTPGDVYKLLLMQHKDDEDFISQEEVKQLRKNLAISKMETSEALSQRDAKEQGLLTAHEVSSKLQSELLQTKQEKSLAENQVNILQECLDTAQEERNKLQKEADDLKRKCQEQQSNISTLVEKLSVSQTQAMSNKEDFKEERKDRERAHSMLADSIAKFEKERGEWKAKESTLVSQLKDAKLKNESLIAQLFQTTKEGESMRKKMRKLSVEDIHIDDGNNKLTKLRKNRSSIWRFRGGKRDELPTCSNSTQPVCEDTTWYDRSLTKGEFHTEKMLSTSISIPSDSRNEETLSVSAPATTSYSGQENLMDIKPLVDETPLMSDSLPATAEQPPSLEDSHCSQPDILEREPDWISQGYIEKVQALYDYFKKKDGDLSFTSGTIIYVLKKNSDGWNEGIISGVFPANYVKTVN